MSTNIRQATPADQHAIEAIIQEAFSIYIARIGRKPQPMLDDYTALINDRVVYVIEHDGEIKGTVMLVPREDAMIVDNLAVAQSARGTGLGRQLLEFADESARLAGYQTLQLHTNETMVENIAIYTRMGNTAYCEIPLAEYDEIEVASGWPAMMPEKTGTKEHIPKMWLIPLLANPSSSLHLFSHFPTKTT
ncbi:hypothetical protein AbraIFM66951_006378 [Aspergillus brasiliensis]|uniref:N-acetyltransferase domain-containing protein n=1 Tax=Aspergillus brasiliensis TaxID=319629 RepID=A0A9W5YF91_9EURO|nr:hypothetical protein AbraCBS73388_004271 [Aspergillus brasiliensis]GKZ40844.1 hypothetical protein AbraIFM66951_006378 [Aspergillus brasiliensis]